MNLMTAYLLRYAELGFVPFPVRAGSNAPPEDWKKPALPSWEHLQTRRPTHDELRVWGQQYANCGIALACGRISNMVAVDDDRAGKPPNPDADNFIAACARVETATGRTGKGHHFLFRPPKDMWGQVSLLPGTKLFGGAVELRGEGQYIVVPPSMHATGRRYEWIREPEDGIAELPPMLLAMIRASKKDGQKLYKTAVLGVPEGTRDDSATSILGQMIALAHPDTWDAEVWPMFYRWNERNNPPLPLEDIQRVYASITGRERSKRKAMMVVPAVEREMPPVVLSEDLHAKRFSPLGYAVNGLFADGVTRFCGKPKSGKSILTLQTALAVASGKPLFEPSISMYAHARHPQGFDTQQGDVLYLALEDSEMRLQSRIRAIWGPAMPPHLTLATTWWTSLDGGLSSIENWIKSVKNPRFIGIDTVAAFFGEPSSRSAFRADYRMFYPVWELAQKWRVPFVLVDHRSKDKGKTGSSDAFDSVAGTLGGSAAVDSIVLLERELKIPRRGSLRVSSRDFDCEPFEIELAKDAPLWKIATPIPASEEKVADLSKKRAQKQP